MVDHTPPCVPAALHHTSLLLIQSSLDGKHVSTSHLTLAPGWLDGHIKAHYTESGWWTWWAGVLPIGYQTTKTFPSSFLMPSWWYEPHQCLATPSGPVGICPCSELVLANGLKAAYYDHISWVHLLMNRWQSSGWNKQFKASSGS